MLVRYHTKNGLDIKWAMPTTGTNCQTTSLVQFICSAGNKSIINKKKYSYLPFRKLPGSIHYVADKENTGYVTVDYLFGNIRFLFSCGHLPEFISILDVPIFQSYQCVAEVGVSILVCLFSAHWQVWVLCRHMDYCCYYIPQVTPSINFINGYNKHRFY